MQNDEIINLLRNDWTVHNQQVIKYCLGLANQSVLDRTADYTSVTRLSTIRGFLRWDLLDYHLDRAAQIGLFEGITSHWKEFKGAKILELVGQFSCLTACHILNQNDDPKESEYGHRKTNREKN